MPGVNAPILVSVPNKSHRLVSTTLWVTGATLALVALFMTAIEFVSERTVFLDTLRAQARMVAEHASAPVVFQDMEAASATLSPLRINSDMREAEIDAGESVLAKISFSGEPQQSAVTIIAKPDIGFLESRMMVAVREPIMVDGSQVGEVMLRATMASVYGGILRNLFTYLLILLATLGMAYLVLRRLQGDILDAEARLAQQAHFDGVTGLPNRNAFNDMLAHAVARLKREPGSFALLYLDLDNFKLINDTMGHQAGDQLLALVGQRLHAQLREADSIYRLGGDEFTIVADPCSDATAAAILAEKMIQSLDGVFEIAGEQVHVTASIGISLYPADAANLETLVRNADTAMYHAKERGKNNFQFFSAFMEERARQRMAIEKAMRRAFEQDEFRLHYQPLVNLADGQTMGCEALLRWNNAELGDIGPSEFIPVAEETGFIVPLGRRVLLDACRQAKAWSMLGCGVLRVNVNLSGRQLYEANFTRQIRDILRETDIDPSWLELEITESMLMDNLDQSIQRLYELRSLGVTLAIDDFGTGYSSMSYLKRLPVSKLKIDQSFVRDIVVDKDDAAIASAIIALGHSLGMQVVAEGVEQAAQADILRKLGCDMAQGFHYGKAVTGDAIARHLLAQCAQ